MGAKEEFAVTKAILQMFTVLTCSVSDNVDFFVPILGALAVAAEEKHKEHGI